MSLFMYNWPQSLHYCSHLLNILCLLFVIGFYPQHCSIFNLLTCSLCALFNCVFALCASLNIEIQHKLTSASTKKLKGHSTDVDAF